MSLKWYELQDKLFVLWQMSTGQQSTILPLDIKISKSLVTAVVKL